MAEAPISTPPRARSSEERLRVLHLLTSDAFAGLERHVLGLVRELRALGCDAEIACPPSAVRIRQEAAACGVPVRPAGYARSRTWLTRVARSVAARSPHVIHVHDGRSALAAEILAPLGGGLLVRTQHFTRPASVERKGVLGGGSVVLHRFLNRRLDGYISVSNAVAAAARCRRETGRAELAVVPPGIRIPGAEAVATAKERRKASSTPTVVFIGRLESEKRLEVLIAAVPLVLERVPHCRFIIGGSGSHEAELKLLASTLRVASAITWTGWVREPDQILGSAHLYVNTWPWEAFGMAMAEAMASGLPVVAVDSGASPEVVIDGVCGLLVPSDDPLSLADAIVRMIMDPERSARFGQAARERAVAEYGAELTGRATLAFYERLLDKARP